MSENDWPRFSPNVMQRFLWHLREDSSKVGQCPSDEHQPWHVTDWSAPPLACLSQTTKPEEAGELSAPVVKHSKLLQYMLSWLEGRNFIRYKVPKVIFYWPDRFLAGAYRKGWHGWRSGWWLKSDIRMQNRQFGIFFFLIFFFLNPLVNLFC